MSGCIAKASGIHGGPRILYLKVSKYYFTQPPPALIVIEWNVKASFIGVYSVLKLEHHREVLPFGIINNALQPLGSIFESDRSP